MKFTLIINRYGSYILFSLLLWAAWKTGEAIGGEGSYKSTYLFLLIAGGGAGLYFAKQLGSLSVFFTIIFFFWIPFNSRLDTLMPWLYKLFPTEFGLWMLLLVSLISRGIFQKNKTKKYFNGPFLPWILFIGGAIIANAGSISEMAAVKIRFICILPLLTVFICCKFIRDTRSAEKGIMVMLLSGFLLGLIVLYAPQITYGNADYRLFIDSMERGRLAKVISLPRCGPFIYSPETGAIAFSMLTVIAFSLYLRHPSSRISRGSGFISLLFIYIIINSQGRGALISLFAALISVTFLDFFVLRKSQYELKSKFIKLGVVLAAGSSYLIYKVNTLSDKIMYARMHSLLTNPLEAHGVLDRVERWKVGVDVYLDNIIFGVGLFGFPFGATKTSWYVHNLYLYIVLSFGIIGFLGFFWILAQYLKIFLKGFRSDDAVLSSLSAGGLGCIVVLLVAGMTSCYFSSVYHVFIFWLPVGIISAAAISHDRQVLKAQR